MSRNILKSRLWLELIISAAASLLISATLLLFLQNSLYDVIEEIAFSEEFQTYECAKSHNSLQAYINENHLSLRELSAIDVWTNKNSYVHFTLQCGDKVIYDSMTGPVAESDLFLYEDYFADDYLGPISFSDGLADASFTTFIGYEYYNAALALSYALSFLLFITLLAIPLRIKLKYVEKMKMELEILEGGNLSHPVTVQGNDELSELAASVESMRLSLLKRQLGEENARTANQELITAMSHDLRTPLTSLLGYLDIVEMKKYSSEQEMERFIRIGREKAYQIKSMSDKLFEYFLVYATDVNSGEAVDADAFELVNQLLSDGIFDLESRGFTVLAPPPKIFGSLKIYPDLLRRAFDNIFSNIRKYADPARPVGIDCSSSEGWLELVITNYIPKSSDTVESTKIGIKTCQKALSLHGGSMDAELDGEMFSVKVRLPIQ